MNDEKRINRTSYCAQWQFRLETRDGDWCSWFEWQEIYDRK
jgi:hypothetical protein